VQSAIADPRGVVAAYLCTRATGEAVPASRARLRLPDGVYGVTFIDPRNLRASDPVRVEKAGIGRVAEIALPAFTDDIMVKIERIAERRRTAVEGTK
jgi:hypothetical protein